MVKELAERLQHPRPFFFDNRGHEGNKFEQAVENAANLLRSLARNGVAVSFSTWEGHHQSNATGGAVKSALRHLALITPAQGATEAGFQAWRAQAIREHGGVFLKGELPLPPGLPPCEIVPL
jgi:hypothetical protein